MPRDPATLARTLGVDHAPRVPADLEAAVAEVERRKVEVRCDALGVERPRAFVERMFAEAGEPVAKVPARGEPGRFAALGAQVRERRSATRRANAAKGRAAREVVEPGEWRFTVEGRPVGKGRPRLGRNGTTYTPAETRDYEALVARSARAAGVRAGGGPCAVRLDVWTASRRRLDLDNVLKACVDGLVAAGRDVLADDACTVVTRMDVQWCGVDGDRPRVEVTVSVGR